jgi:HEAT repeat protein
MYLRLPAALLLSTAIAAAASSQAPKEKEGEPKGNWPVKVDGKDVHEWLKALHDPDPNTRHKAVLALGQLSPWDVRKVCGKELLKKIAPGGEPDNGVRLYIIDLVGEIGLDDSKDSKEAIRILTNSAVNGRELLRLRALQALGKFGQRAHDVAKELVKSTVITVDEPSYESRLALTNTLGRIGASEATGPDPTVVAQLSRTLTADKSLVVRIAALQSLVVLGPAYEPGFVHKPEAKQPIKFDEEAKKKVAAHMKTLIANLPGKEKETDKQLEMWYRQVAIRFAGDTEADKTEAENQVKAIARYLTDKDHVSARLLALQLVGMVGGELAGPHVKTIIGMTSDPEPVVRVGAIQALATIAGQTTRMLKVMAEFKDAPANAKAALEAIVAQVSGVLVQLIANPNQAKPDQALQMRVAALDGLAMLGEKAAAGDGLTTVTAIVKDLKNIESAEGITLLTHALGALAAMGVKAQPAVFDLEGLKRQVLEAKLKRLNSEEHKKLISSPEIKALLEALPAEQRKQLLSGENTAEDQFAKVIEKSIAFINESAPGRPGPAPKKVEAGQ